MPEKSRKERKKENKLKVLCEDIPDKTQDLLAEYEDRRMKTKEETLNYISMVRSGERLWPRFLDVCDEFYEWAEKVRYLLWKIFEK